MRRLPIAPHLPAVLLTLFFLPPLHAQPAPGPFSEAITAIETAVRREMADKDLPALSLVLVDDQKVVWSAGFGLARPKDKTPAARDTVYRVGSVSKLFTDLALMQLVEEGKVDIDAPIQTYLPDFHPANSFGKEALTLRQLMSHRSGLVREPPLGSYFDSVDPGITATVASLNDTRLIYPPTKHTKYSNAGITVVGQVVERLRGQSFADAMQKSVLEPLGCTSSGFRLTPALERNVATGKMWTYHGATFDAPTFAMGIEPAGSLYTTVEDLARFLSMLFAGGKGSKGTLAKPATLESMYRIQFAKPDAKRGFGLGFMVNDFKGHRSVGHDGAVYGFATTLVALPDDKLGVVMVTTLESANSTTGRLAQFALDAMLAVRAGKPVPAYKATEPLSASEMQQAAGVYRAGEETIELAVQNGKLYSWGLADDSRLELRRLGNVLVADDVLGFAGPVKLDKDTLTYDKKTFKRVPVERPAPPPARWADLIGEYGPDYDILYILESEGKLVALIEWYSYYPLEEVSPSLFKFPKSGMYDNEQLSFQRDGSGKVTSVTAAGVVFKRRPLPGEGQTFKIEPRRAIETVRREALAATPPAETGYFNKPDLVDLTLLDPTIKLDIRYASVNNFLGAPLYTSARAFLQKPAAEALVRVHKELARQGFGLLIHDAYRPWYVTRMFWDATQDKDHIFVADPSKGSRHNRGCAVDLTLYDLKTGKPLVMTGGYDEFSDRSYPFYPGGTSRQRWQRDLLREAMSREGFTVFTNEWWHFDFKDWKKYPIMNVRFEEVKE